MRPLIIKEKKSVKSPPPVINTDIDINSIKIDTDQQITQELIYTIQDKIILTHGGFLVLTGKPKARKSTFLHTFLAVSVLKTQVWGIKSHLNDDKSGIVLIDTEQTMYDMITSLRRLESAFSIKLSTYKNFSAYSTRSLSLDETLTAITKIADNTPNLGVIAIDGLIDLVNDINDVREAKECIHYIKNLADKKNIGIIGIIHQNKGTNFSLGHLGSFASRFAQSELSIEKTDSGSSIMKPTYLRSADDFQAIEIDYDQNYNRYDLISNITKAVKFDQAEIIDQIFAGKVGITYADLCTGLRIHLECSNYEVQKKIVPVLYADGYIKKCGNLIQKSFVYNP
jgi:hypothetical protein